MDRVALAEERGSVFVVEGVSDTATFIDAFPDAAVVGIPGAGGFKARWAFAFGGLDIYVLADNDDAGRKLRARLERIVGPLAVHVQHVVVPEPYKDVSDWRGSVGPAEFTGFFEALEMVP